MLMWTTKQKRYGSGGLTYDASNEDPETELGFNLRPRDTFRFASEHVPIDILAE